MKKRLIATLSLTALLAATASIPAAARGAGHDAKPKSCTDSKLTEGCVAATNSTAGNAIYGLDTSTGIGVLGLNTTEGIGVEGQTYGSASTAGVAGIGWDAGIGVFGSSHTGTGVSGSTGGAGYGVLGFSGGAGAGVFGIYHGCGCVNGTAIGGIGGLSLVPGAPAVYGMVTTNNGSPLAQFYGGSGGFATLDDLGDLTLSGDLYTAGFCYMGCSKTRGVLEPAARSAEATLDDQGEATLRNGAAHVALDPAFANAIDAHRSYIVTVTLEGEANEVYVTNRTPNSFDVRETHGGRSSVGFAYRIVAKPLGAPPGRLTFVKFAPRPAPPIPSRTLPNH